MMLFINIGSAYRLSGYINVQIIGIGYKKSISVDPYTELYIADKSYKQTKKPSWYYCMIIKSKKLFAKMTFVWVACQWTTALCSAALSETMLKYHIQ